MPNKLLSIIIVNYKSEKFLPACLTSIKAKINPYIQTEVIVLNNDKDAGLDFLKEQFPEVSFIESGKNLGFGAGNNKAAQLAKGDFFLFLNPDTEILSQNIQDVMELFKNDPGLGVVGSRFVSPSGQIQPWSAGYETGVWDLFLNNLKIRRSQKIWESQKPIEAQWVSGAGLFVRADLFRHIGGFDENYFMYFEDADLCKKIRALGQRIFFYPAFVIRHIGGQSYSGNSRQKDDYYRSQAYYFQKNKRFLENLVYRGMRKFLL